MKQMSKGRIKDPLFAVKAVSVPDGDDAEVDWKQDVSGIMCCIMCCHMHAASQIGKRKRTEQSAGAALTLYLSLSPSPSPLSLSYPSS
jgi:hypothetical protein